MSALSWQPPALGAAILGAAAFALWLFVWPPWREGRLAGLLKGAAALLLALALFDVGCRLPAGAATPRLALLLDRSGSMQVSDTSGKTRSQAARAWLESGAFADWSAGWRVELDSFGGSTTDLAGTVEAAETTLPDVILVVSDGRAAGGRSLESGAIRRFAIAPGPTAVIDAAIVDIAVEELPEGGAVAVVEVGAVGGLATRAPGRVTVAAAGRPVARAVVPPLDPGERRVLRLPLPALPVGASPIEATVRTAGDAVPGNDRRALVWPGGGAERAFAVGLRPGWDFAPWMRALAGAHAGPVDVSWSGPGGRLRRVGGGSTAWAALDPARHGVLYLIGDPAALGEAGRARVEAFLAAGGRGLFWGPEGRGGSLAGTGIVLPEPSAREHAPSLTAEGAAWLTARGADPAAVPDGSAAWPPLEALPAGGARPAAGAAVLLEAGGQPVAWAVERGSNRIVVAAGTGYYRWPLATGVGPAAGGGPPAFWEAWTGAVVRWLAAASPVARPLVRMPPAGRVAPGSRLEAPVAADAAGAVRWRIERTDGPDTGEEAASGVLAEAAGEAERRIVAGPLAPGWYRLTATAGSRRASEIFVVEMWTPDLAWTAADTASLGAAARASGGELLTLTGPLSPLPQPAETAGPPASRRAFGFGTAPWAYLAAGVLLIAGWALGARGEA